MAIVYRPRRARRLDGGRTGARPGSDPSLAPLGSRFCQWAI